MKYIFFSLLLTLYSLEAASQVFNVTLYADREGFPKARINDVYEDSAGYVWLATEEGLFKFNGKKFIIVDQDRYHKFVVINPSMALALGKQKILTLRPFADPDSALYEFLKEKNLNGKFIYDIAATENGQVLWILSEPGLFRFANETLVRFDLADFTSTYADCVLTTAYRTIQLITRNGAIYQMDRTKGQFVKQQGGLSFYDIRNKIIHNDTTLTLYYGQNTVRLSPEMQPSYHLLPGISENITATTVAFWRNDLLLGTKASGLWLSRKTKSGDTFIKIMDGSEPHRTAELPSNHIRKLFCAGNGNIWAVSANDVMLLQERPFRRVSTDVPLASTEQVAILDNGKVFIDTDNGIFECTRDQHGNYHGRPSPMLANKILPAIAAKGSRLWLSDIDYNVFYVENGRFSKKVSLKDRGNTVFYMFADSKGNLWISQAPGAKPVNGMLKITSDLKVQEYGSDAGFANRMLVTKQSPSGKVYCAGIGERTYLYEYDEATDSFVNISAEINFDAGENFEVHDLAVGEDNVIWLASTAGLLRFENNSIEKIQFDELYENEIVAVAIAKDGAVWFSTDRRGIVRYDNGRYSIFDQKAGLASNAMTYRSLSVDSEGQLWAGSREGVFIIDPAVNGWRKTNKPVILGVTDTKGNQLSGNTFPFKLPLRFEFASLTYPVASTQYAYRLVGYNVRWVNHHKNDSLWLTNMKSGQYTLEVRARQLGGYEWSEPLVYNFTVSKVWYLQSQAIVFYVLVVVSLVIAGVRVYNRRLREEKKLLEAKVRERTVEITQKNEEILRKNDEISQQMNELKHLSDEIATQRDNLYRQKEVIEQQNNLLGKAKTELERMVIERTHELSFANQELMQQNVQLEQFAFMTAHNLRGPVARLMGLTSIFDRTKASDDFNREVIGKIQESASSLDEVIRDIGTILHVKKGINGTFTGINVFLLLQKVLDSFRDEIKHKNVEIVNGVNPVINVKGVEPYAYSVFYNIISNSIKYADDAKAPRITITGTELSETVQLVFADNGIGFDAMSHKDKLFKPFSRFNADREGKGLGLYLMKIEMESMHGSIDIQSIEDVGTTVTLEFRRFAASTNQ